MKNAAPTGTCPDMIGRPASAEAVAPTLRSARGDVAASLPRHGGVKPPLRHADLKVSATMPGTDPAHPFTQEQVVSMVRDGFGDESGAKLIEQRGIDFAPARLLSMGSQARTPVSVCIPRAGAQRA